MKLWLQMVVSTGAHPGITHHRGAFKIADKSKNSLKPSTDREILLLAEREAPDAVVLSQQRP